jgi:hypothetical protein
MLNSPASATTAPGANGNPGSPSPDEIPFIPRVWTEPAATATNPTLGTGTLPWPQELSPQATTEPSALSPRLCPTSPRPRPRTRRWARACPTGHIGSIPRRLPTRSPSVPGCDSSPRPRPRTRRWARARRTRVEPSALRLRIGVMLVEGGLNGGGRGDDGIHTPAGRQFEVFESD